MEAWLMRLVFASRGRRLRRSVEVLARGIQALVEPAMKEAQNSNFPSALDIVENGLNAHPASEGLMFLKAYFGYKVADTMSSELTSFPKVIQPLGNGALMVDG